MPDRATLLRARRWLLLGCLALGVAGIFAGLLGSSKSAYFDTALTLHVDLSVLVWFLTMAGMFFTLGGQGRGWAALADASFFAFAGGTCLLVASGFTGGEVYKSNYIPVIYHPVFFLGLAFMFCGILGVAINLVAGRGGQIMNVQSYGTVSAGWIMLIALACFVRSQQALPADMHGQVYYEYAFWGGGHVLQFAHTQLMLVAWLWLAEAAGIRIKLSAGQITVLFFAGLMAMFAAAFVYAVYPPQSGEHRDAFTLLMKHANGLAPMVLGIAVIYAALIGPRGKGAGVPKVALYMSVLLFGVGGGLGFLIAGSNVTVPAHYHGSIVGITLAFMGVCYLLLPTFGFADVSRSKLALIQPIIYGGGQLCWMSGMAMLGASGVPRKTAGSADTAGALAAFLKHGGDGLALIGGLLFVFVVLRAVYKSKGAKIGQEQI